jgi:hypothetical protein
MGARFFGREILGNSGRGAPFGTAVIGSADIRITCVFLTYHAQDCEKPLEKIKHVRPVPQDSSCRSVVYCLCRFFSSGFTLPYFAYNGSRSRRRENQLDWTSSVFSEMLLALEEEVCIP